ncbi:MAG TPA: molybdenum ABC transporter ATP-binding protein [Steroidobacteraceae bacterium]|nr:molybdenum ABC transporter ATP-binding protein [Steroidobacteraceae bacterium]
MTLSLRASLARADFTLDVECDIPTRGITGVFGRSGSGKTTLLRCIAGLERAVQARIECDGELWQDEGRFVPTYRRAVGYVFQESSLFAHLDVRGNLEFGLHRVPLRERRLEFDEVVALLDLSTLLRHRAPQLSGGERQRVAIARALLTSPRLLLMDEPVSNLDERSKAQILPHLERLRDSSAIPIIYVSHALGEILRLADHLILLQSGRVRAAGPLQQLLARSDLPLGHFEDSGSVFDAVVEEHDPNYHLTYVRICAGRLAVALRPVAVGHRIRVRIDARDVSLALKPPELSSIINILPATVLELSGDADPAQTLVRLEAGAEPLLARITRRSAVQLGLSPGTVLYAQVKSVSLMESSATGLNW